MTDERDREEVRTIAGPFVHRIDPVLGRIGGVHLWWYGLSYTLAFFQTLLFLRRHRSQLRLTRSEAYALALMFSAGVLIGGRAIQVAFDEWPFYREPNRAFARPSLAPRAAEPTRRCNPG